jgi:predicted nucleotidyltransferase
MIPGVIPPIQSAARCAESLQQLREARLVRLDDVEAEALAEALDGIAAHTVELFGSRTDPAGRGGDIDVLIMSDAPRFETARQVSSRFFSKCEERIDVVLLDPDNLTPAEAAFLQSLRRVRIA